MCVFVSLPVPTPVLIHRERARRYARNLTKATHFPSLMAEGVSALGPLHPSVSGHLSHRLPTSRQVAEPFDPYKARLVRALGFLVLVPRSIGLNCIKQVFESDGFRRRSELHFTKAEARFLHL